MLLLKRIKLNNFISHLETELFFSPKEKVSLEGASGAGKSSIFDAIVWALYGQGRTENKSIIRKGASQGSVALELSEGKTDYLILRSASTNGKTKLSVIVKEEGKPYIALPLQGIRETQAWIDKELVGASWLLFVNSVAYVQGGGDNFVSQSAPKRKELLLELVNADDFKKYYENARTAILSKENQQQTIQGQIETLRGFLEPMEREVEQSSELTQALNSFTEENMLLKKELASLEEKKALYVESMQALVHITANLKTAVENRNFVEKMLLERQEDIADKKRIIKVLEKAKGTEEKLQKSQKELSRLMDLFQEASKLETERNVLLGKKPLVTSRTGEIDRIQKNINRILAEPVCPSGIKCPYSGDHSKQVKKLEAQIKEAKELIFSEEMDLAKWKIQWDCLPPITNVPELLSKIKDEEESGQMLQVGLRQLDSLKKDLENIEGIEKKIPEIEVTLKEKQEHVNSLEEQKKVAEKTAKAEELVTVVEELKVTSERQKLVANELVLVTDKLKSIEEAKDKIKEISGKITAHKKESGILSQEIGKLMLAKTAFSPRGGIETLVIDYLLPKLEDKINEILAQLSDFRIRLDTQKKSSDGEASIEGLFITVLNESGAELPYESYSGGEKVRITFAITEALASLNQKKIGWRLIDEAVVALDPNSLEAFMSVLAKILTDFDQVLFISHIQDVQDLFPKKILCSKKDNISKIKHHDET